MSFDWKYRRLGDCCLKIGSGATPRGGKDSYMNSGAIRLFRSQNIANSGFLPKGLVFINEEQAKKLDGVIVEAGDVLLNITGDSVARVCQAPARYLPARVNQHVVIIRPKKEIFNPGFLRYFLSSPQQQRVMLGLATSGATRPALTKAMVEDFSIPCPPLVEQNEIVRILASLDHCIDLLRETNQTLDSIVQAIFKSWFVDFYPVRAKAEGIEPEGLDAATAALFPDSFDEGELGFIPKGWCVGRLGSWLRVLETGRRPKGGVSGITGGVPSIGAESIVKIGEFDYSKTKFVSVDFFKKMNSGKLESYDVLLYKDGGKPGVFLPRVSMSGHGFPFDVCGINEHVFRVRIEKPFCQVFLYYWLWSDAVMHELKHRGGKAAIPGINQSDVKDLKLILPNEKILKRFEDITTPIVDEIFYNSKQAQILAKIRDALLPKLISGEIRLREAESIMESAVFA